jgi:hypothetical protein
MENGNENLKKTSTICDEIKSRRRRGPRCWKICFSRLGGYYGIFW